MKMDIPGVPEDYFTEIETDAGNKAYKANRERIRALVAIRNMKTQEVLSSGGNIHQASLDLNDQFDEFLSPLPVMAQAAICGIYAEELSASAAEMMDKTHRINAEIIESEERNSLMGQVIGVIVIIVIAVVVISTF
ncbi:hypothetical protein LJPFL01_2211 [Lelliottia jeotgali]|uniref:hypothetical protein n=1 Tax=Citrobacter braakii TaxID=57706 RepID=UPI000BA70576|nr:hypothetical protein [Citrobacter braakii]ASV55574.1 hypothetical protein LJPFL01_2211 [Lelliottia jeotgali]MDU4065916.1 hypothetical protein [Enterobacter asburiae]WOI83505.1 hypothetical protein R0Q77_11545 [Citrobacter braakii]